MADSGCGEGAAVGGMATELFQLASLLVGDEDQALRLIESSLSTMEIDPCRDLDAAREQARGSVVRSALAQLMTAEPEAFLAGAAASGEHNPCIQDKDMEGSELHSWLEQDERPELGRSLRQRLEDLPVVQRAIFVQRAVLGLGNEAAAQLLREAGGMEAGAWTPQHVGETFRKALCSLASSLIHAAGAAPVPA